MKLKQRDLLIAGGFVAIGAVIYLFFFTNVITGWFGIESEAESVSVKQTRSGFENFNTKVEEKEVAEYENKEEAYEAEYQAKEQAQAQEEELERVKQTRGEDQYNNKVNDLSELMGEKKGNKKSTVNEAQSVNELTSTTIIKPKPSTVSQPKKQVQVIKEPVAVTEPKPKKRTRNANPSFGEEVIEKESKGKKTAGGIIHGTQSVTNGSRVVIRITEQFQVTDCVLLEANTMLTGTCKVERDRIYITVGTTCDSGESVKFQVLDPSDNTAGLYIEIPSDDSQVQKDIAGDVIQQGSQAVGIPIVGRTLSKVGSRRLTTDKIPLESGRKLSIERIK